MTNPYPTTATDIDIHATANRVTALLQQHRGADALRLLEQERRGERPAVQEALDRYVAAAAPEQLAALRQRDGLAAAEAAALAPTLARLQHAKDAPRMPVYQDATAAAPTPPNELVGLTDAQKHDVYASMVEARGATAAHDALARRGERVVLGLRNENSTLATGGTTEQTGKGVYNDHLVVLWTDAAGARHVQVNAMANTEPTAQYDHHAGSNGRRPLAEGGTVARRDASPGFEGVRNPRKVEGTDVNGDGVRDLGRLAAGTIEMERTTHPNPRGGAADFSLRPTAAAVRNGAHGVQRDTNADGRFDANDRQGADDLNNSFKIHRGSTNSTDSAGCQTIQGAGYDRFVTAVSGGTQRTWQYVLTDAVARPPPELVRGHAADTPAATHATPHAAAHPAAAHPAVPPAALPDAHPAAHPAARPAHAAPGPVPLSSATHPDHALYQGTLAKLEALGAAAGLTTAAERENAAGRLVYEAKVGGLQRIDQVVPNQRGDGLIAVQGDVGDPAMRRVLVDRGEAVQHSVQDSSRRIAQDVPAMQVAPAVLAQNVPEPQQRPMAH